MKFILACLIPFLHLPFENSFVIYFIQQYISRLGVPFFFAFSGLMLGSSIYKRGNKEALVRYVSRISILIISWLIIYSPILYVSMKDQTNIIQILIFKTPAFLWYLTALLFAVIPFSLIKNRKVLYIISFALYLTGTLLGGNYEWLTGGYSLYEKIFLTTRNGAFFALPFICLGDSINNLPRLSKKAARNGFIISLLLLYLEITVVSNYVGIDSDRSMYIVLPIVIFFLVGWTLHLNPSINTNFIRGASTAIYLMQFGVITVMLKLFSGWNLPLNVISFIVYLVLLVGACSFYWVSYKNKYLHYLF